MKRIAQTNQAPCGAWSGEPMLAVVLRLDRMENMRFGQGV